MLITQFSRIDGVRSTIPLPSQGLRVHHSRTLIDIVVRNLSSEANPVGLAFHDSLSEKSESEKIKELLGPAYMQALDVILKHSFNWNDVQAILYQASLASSIEGRAEPTEAELLSALKGGIKRLKKDRKLYEEVKQKLQPEAEEQLLAADWVQLSSWGFVGHINTAYAASKVRVVAHPLSFNPEQEKLLSDVLGYDCSLTAYRNNLEDLIHG